MTKISNQILEEIQYIVIPMHTDSIKNDRDILFNYWNLFWTKVFNDLNTGSKPDPNEFYKQDLVTYLKFREEIVAMHLLKFYNKNDFDKNQYFYDYNKQFFTFLENERIQNTMTLQYLSVDEKWQGRKTGVNFSAIITALSLNQQIYNNIDCTITLARKDVPSASMAQKLGMYEVCSSTMHNAPVAQMFCRKLLPHPTEEVNLWTRYYFNQFLNTHKQSEQTVAA